MRKFLLAAGLLLAGASAQAQITPEKVYQGSGTMVRMSNGDYKYLLERFTGSASASQYTLYNLNHSVFKQITPPLLGAGYSTPSVSYISNGLFDTNPATVEYLARYYDPNNGNPLRTIVYSETGSSIAVLDSTYDVEIYNTPVGTKLLANKRAYSSTGTLLRDYTRVYSLPGQLALRAETPAVQQVAGAYPNPAETLVNLPYSVPAGQVGTLKVFGIDGRLVGTYRIDNHTNHLEMGTRDLRPGTYVYTVETANGTTAASRFIIR